MLPCHVSSHAVPGRGPAAHRRPGAAPAVAPGEVWLVGAGPGDPGLLSLRAAAALEAADAVIFDVWIDPAVIALVPAACHREAHGARGRAGEAAVRRCIDLARQGWRVVRLMHGDPMLSGDGAGEARALAEAGLRVHVVPGIPARLAGLSGEALPLTRGDRAAAVCFVDLEREEDPQAPRADVEALARAAPTLVFRLRPAQTAGLVARLAAAGLAPATPAVLVVRPGTACQEVVETTIGAAGGRAGALDPEARLILGLGAEAALDRRPAADPPAAAPAPLAFSMAGAG